MCLGEENRETRSVWSEKEVNVAGRKTSGLRKSMSVSEERLRKPKSG